ncbi:hypothetical protein yc1106_07473 [Curvularia clavata]|uniref:2'-5' RNA ligase family protein n=1 Tax=Curvularia clavata TaxID=95742 RepID=A0A9Q9DVT7_CURCL|nr:hypothetical protein yc1106_07473 [Curvularia clavata]
MTKQLSHKSALVLLPPPGIVEPIEAVRRVYDRQFFRWPPHINLLYPFLLSPSESGRLQSDIRMRIEKVTQNIQPFHMALRADPPGVFHHSKTSKTVWLGPTTRSVRELQAALQYEFFRGVPDCNRRPFRPHISIGQAKSHDAADHLSAEITKSISEFVARNTNVNGGDRPAELGWLVDQVHVIERKGDKDRFKIIGTIRLGEPSASTQQVASDT